jgi:hypothetical protein
VGIKLSGEIWENRQVMGSKASISMYLARADIDLLVSHFNEDEELVWLVGDGADRWIAKQQVGELYERTILWHTPSGPLPLVGTDGDGSDRWVTDPFQGWDEPQSWRQRTEPVFFHPGVYSLRITPPDSPYLEEPEQIGLSGIGWLANYYSAIGRPAHPATERHWKALRRWITSLASVPSVAANSSQRRRQYAFPEALKAIQAGASYETVARALVQAQVGAENHQVWCAG